jgi:hypothetical protein
VDLAAIFVAVWLLQDQERRDDLRTEAMMLRQAYLTNYAVNGPDKLQSEAKAFERRLSQGPIATEANDEALRDARAAVEAARAARRR